MIDPILTTPISIAAPSPLAPATAANAPATSFSSLFSEAVGSVENYRAQADGALNRFLTGEQEDVHTVAVASQRAELSFELFLQVKNKAVQAYQEVMRMQL